MKLLHGDCLIEMQQIEDKSIDMILCDLPYGTTHCKWDSIIPFDLLWNQYERIIKDEAAIVLFGSQPFTSLLVNSKIEWYRDEIIWLKNKAGSGFHLDQKHQKVHENIIVFAKHGKHNYHPQKWLVSSKEFLTQRKTFKEFECGNTIYPSRTRVRKEDNGIRNPLSIVSCRVPFIPQKNIKYSIDVDIRIHPTQKPVELLKYLIKTYTNEHQTVLDNCMGSGSTGIACLETDRKFIGIEKDNTYFKLAKQRINNHQWQSSLF